MKAGNDQFVGISLKADHVDEILDRKPSIGFFEVHTENYTNAGGPNHHFLSRIAEDYQLSFHGVGLSIGSEDGIDLAHLERIAATIARYNPFITSEHLSWSTYKGQYLADLLPVTYDQTTLNRMSEHIDLIQNRFGRSILIENPSQYVPAPKSDYSEAGFLNELVARTGCGLLLDVNNIVVSSHNLNLKSEDFLEELNLQHIGEIHLAGHATKEFNGEPIRIDDHGSNVDDETWGLYSYVIARTGPIPSLIEWDTDIPSLNILLDEADKAVQIMNSANTEQTESLRRHA